MKVSLNRAFYALFGVLLLATAGVAQTKPGNLTSANTSAPWQVTGATDVSRSSDAGKGQRKSSVNDSTRTSRGRSVEHKGVADTVKQRPTAGETAATSRGKSEHKRFAQDYGNKKGRASEVRMNNIETRQGSRPDLTTRSGRPVELKPGTVSGRRAMGKQLPRYETTMNRRGIRVYYDQRGERRFERTPYHEWRMRGEPKPRLRPAP